VIIDPGDEAEKIQEVLEQHRLEPRYVVHTHAHIDHILAADRLRREHGAQVCIHKGDAFLWDGVQMQASFLGGLLRLPVSPLGRVDRFLQEGDSVPFGPHRLEVLETPGHSPGSICLLLHPEGEATRAGSSVIFSGDTLFQWGIGRTDLWGGSPTDLLRSIRERLFTLDPEMTVYPGHGPLTTIGEEKAGNPFLSEIARV